MHLIKLSNSLVELIFSFWEGKGGGLKKFPRQFQHKIKTGSTKVSQSWNSECYLLNIFKQLKK